MTGAVDTDAGRFELVLTATAGAGGTLGTDGRLGGDAAGSAAEVVFTAGRLLRSAASPFNFFCHQPTNSCCGVIANPAEWRA